MTEQISRLTFQFPDLDTCVVTAYQPFEFLGGEWIGQAHLTRQSDGQWRFLQAHFQTADRRQLSMEQYTLNRLEESIVERVADLYTPDVIKGIKEQRVEELQQLIDEKRRLIAEQNQELDDLQCQYLRASYDLSMLR